MSEINILKTDSRGRITLPPPFRKEPLFEYIVEGDQIVLYPVRTVRKYPDMSDLPTEELSARWLAEEQKVNKELEINLGAVISHAESYSAQSKIIASSARSFMTSHD